MGPAPPWMSGEGWLDDGGVGGGVGGGGKGKRVKEWREKD
jgi:hypothetical protein